MGWSMASKSTNMVASTWVALSWWLLSPYTSMNNGGGGGGGGSTALGYVSAFSSSPTFTTTTTTAPASECARPRFPIVHGIDFRMRRGLELGATPETETEAGTDNDSEGVVDWEDEDAPAGVGGAQFFGGSAVKEELYDPVEEARAATVFRERYVSDEVVSYDRMNDVAAFPDAFARDLAQRLQEAVNAAVNVTSSMTADPVYADGVQWESPYRSTDAKKDDDGNDNGPLGELRRAASFYREIDLAILAARSLSPNVVEIRWVVSVQWPNLWEARVVATGTSELTLEKSEDETPAVVVAQVDRPDEDPLTSTFSQILPRFWDMYHIGMTPSAEVVRRTYESSILPKSYRLFTVPPCLAYRPSSPDLRGRDFRVAQSVPDHALGDRIQTVGPRKESYVTCSPVEVAVTGQRQQRKVIWTLPLPASFARRTTLPLPCNQNSATAVTTAVSKIESEEDRRRRLEEESLRTVGYEYLPARKIATVPFGGSPQDEEVGRLRKQLYDAVVRDGLRPKLVEGSSQPSFVFFQNDAKACYTPEGGLGMVVYEWRPSFTRSNEIGIELEL